MYNRCPLLTLPFICMHVVVAEEGVIMHLGWATWWVTVQQWSFKWGGREARQGWLLLPSALPESLVAALSLTDPLCLFSPKSTKYPWIPQPELADIMGSTQRTKHTWLYQSPLESIIHIQAFWSGTGSTFGQEAAYQRLKLGWKIVFVCIFVWE